MTLVRQSKPLEKCPNRGLEATSAGRDASGALC